MADQELRALTAVAEALDGIEPDARERVIQWARDRYGSRRPGGSVALRPADPRGRGEAAPTLAALYEQARPRTDADRLVLVAYWFQVVRGESELDSQSLNRALKELGHPISNVARAAALLAAASPTLIVQTRKTGSSNQARRRFRLTTEGCRRAGELLSRT